MTTKAEKPTLQGQRIKTRKRDEKEKYDPTHFRDQIVQGINTAGTDLDAISKFLDGAGNRLDYRRYAEPLFDVLIAGGILAPGGTYVIDSDPNKITKANVCVFSAQDELAALKAHVQLFNKLIRRYKYLERAFEDEMKKILVFLKGFSDSDRSKLASLTGLLLSQGMCTASVLQSLLQEHLVKDGIAINFACETFKVWLTEKDLGSVVAALKKASLENRLMDLLPINKRNTDNLHRHFEDAGLKSLITYQKSQLNAGAKKELQKQVKEMVENEEAVKEIAQTVKEIMKKDSLPEHEVVVLMWNVLMSIVEWNKKEDLLADQAIKHVKLYAPVFSSLTTSTRAELALMVRVQEYCYENMNFMKLFQKIIIVFYKMEVLTEDTVLRWYKESHSTKGKTVFLDQMKKFVEWLNAAEEESEGEDEEDE